MYFPVGPNRSTFSNFTPCPATLQRALHRASDVGAVSERSLSDSEGSRWARATSLARPPKVIAIRRAGSTTGYARTCNWHVTQAFFGPNKIQNSVTNLL